jgi:hypothetical protein
MKSILKTLTLIASFSTLSLTADTVDTGQVVTFNAGDPATAADMNQTIQALVTAINDNAAALAASNTTLLEKVSGSTYKWVSMSLEFAKLSDNQSPDLGISNQAVALDSIITFNADLTLDETFNFREWKVQTLGGISSSETLDLNVTENGVSTWSLAGNTISFIDTTGTVSLDGNVIIISEYIDLSDTDYYTTSTTREVTLGVLVKISD